MIVCNKCTSLIEEPKDEPKKEEDEKRGRYNKSVPKEEAPLRRPSLVSMPYVRIPNGFDFNDVDLCENCRRILARQVNELKFKFMQKEEE